MSVLGPLPPWPWRAGLGQLTGVHRTPLARAQHAVSRAARDPRQTVRGSLCRHGKRSNAQPLLVRFIVAPRLSVRVASRRAIWELLIQRRRIQDWFGRGPVFQLSEAGSEATDPMAIH